MRFFNPDGGEVEMCGNGARCVARLAHEIGAAPDHMSIETVAGTAIHKAVEITFPSEAGQYYQLQCAGDVNSDVWSNLGSPILGVGGSMSTFDTTRHAEQRFYRVIKN